MTSPRLYIPNLLTCLLVFLSSSLVSASENCTTIVDLACDTPGFSILCDLIIASETTFDGLSDESASWTVFAPTDDAFAKVDGDLLAGVANCTSSLDGLLSFHAVYGSEIYGSDLTCKEQITMANGDDTRTVCKDDKIYQKGTLNTREDMPQIISVDIEACNGIVHVVDEVMLPKEKYVSLEDCEEESPPVRATPAAPVTPPPMEEEESCKTIAEFACTDSDFSTLCDLVTEFDLAETLSNGTWTVFAPTDEAFASVEDTASGLTAEQLAEVLTFHAVPDEEIAYEDLICKGKIEMANGETSRTKCKTNDDTGEDYKYQKGSGQLDGMNPKIIVKDVEVCNGIVHVVDNVMIPRL